MRMLQLRAYATPKILIIPQPRFPVPATLGLDGATATLIDDTLACLPMSVCAWALSLIDKQVPNLNIDRNRYHLVPRTAIGFRLQRRFLLKLPMRKHFDAFSGKYKDFLIALFFEIMRYHPDILVVHTTKMGWALHIKQVFPSRKVVIYHHNSEDHLVEEEAFRSLVLGIDAHIFVCDYARKHFERRAKSLGLPTPLAFTVHNGINDQYFAPDPIRRDFFRAELGIPDQKFVALFCGRVIERKGLHKLFDAVEMLDPDVQEQLLVVVAGGEDYYGRQDTPYIAALHQRTAASLLKGKVLFLGYIPRSKVRDVYVASDVLIFPSIELEGLPLVNLEAQAVGLPVIASAIGGVPEEIIHGKTGFLVEPPGDPHQIASYLTMFVKDRPLLWKMGEAASQHARTTFNRQNMASDFVRVVQTIWQKRMIVSR